MSDAANDKKTTKSENDEAEAYGTYEAENFGPDGDNSKNGGSTK